MSSRSVQFKMALNSGRLVTRGIYVPPGGGESQIAQRVLFLAIWDSTPSRTYYTRHQASRIQCQLRVRIKDNNSSPHGKFHRFLFPFSCKFSDLNFASYVLYIYLCGTHREPELPVVSRQHPFTIYIYIYIYIYMYREAIQFKLSLYLKKVGLASRNIVHH